jgi:hypothetical protein
VSYAKYWGYFLAKLAAVAGVMWLAWYALIAIVPEPGYFLRHRLPRFPNDLTFTAAFLVYWLFSVALVVLAVIDQRRRCRVCLRLLRMPVESGSWRYATLLSPPGMERICPYGHGTLAVPQVHTSTSQETSWTAHEDIWKELEQLESRDR